MTLKNLKLFKELTAQLCINSYEGKNGEVVDVLDVWEKHVVQNVEFYFGTKDGVAYVVVRGTDRSKEQQEKIKHKFKWIQNIRRWLVGWKDWIQNFQTKSFEMKDGTVHLGTYEDHVRIWNIIQEFLLGQTSVIVVGHSKGAMQALIIYLYIRWYLPHIMSVKCAAHAPAGCVSKELVKYFDKEEVYVFINGEDFITKIPQWKFTNKVGTVVYLGKKNFFFKIPIVRAAGVKDHYPQLYLKNDIRKII